MKWSPIGNDKVTKKCTFSIIDIREGAFFSNFNPDKPFIDYPKMIELLRSRNLLRGEIIFLLLYMLYKCTLILQPGKELNNLLKEGLKMYINLDTIMDDIPVIDSNIDYWFVRSSAGTYYTDFNINNYIGIGYNEITLEQIEAARYSTQKIKEDLYTVYKDEIDKEKLSQPGKIAGQLIRFTHQIKLNDIVVVPSELSQHLLVGKVTGAPYELTDKELDEKEVVLSYKKSNYKKRIPISWIGSFNRDDADSELYKMIFSQQTLSNINKYKSYINRALFDIYIEDDQLHLTFHVTRKNNVNGKLLGEFIYYYTTIYEKLFPEEIMDIKINVQSPGPIESISKTAIKGLIAFGLFAFVLSAPFGGEFKIGSDLLGTFELKFPGLMNGKKEIELKSIEIENAKEEVTQKKINNIKEAIELSKKLEVPVSELGIELPKDVSEKIQNSINEQETKNNEPN